MNFGSVDVKDLSLGNIHVGGNFLSMPGDKSKVQNSCNFMPFSNCNAYG